MSKEIKVKWDYDVGPCEVTCDIPNTDGLFLDIGATHLFICEKHSKNLIKKMATALGLEVIEKKVS